MARLIKSTGKNYVNINNALVRDKRLSWKARGIFAYMWSQADNWQFYVSEIASHATDGKDALASGLKELEKYGYLRRQNRLTGDGKISGKDWILSDLPSEGKTVQRETRPTENPSLRNNNSKNYQSKELTIESKQYSQAQPDDTSQICKKVVDYLNQKLGTQYKPNASKNKTVINARLNEGYKLDDFKRVIDNKYNDWANDAKMAKYLRPETLFGSKFDGYLNEKSGKIPAQKKRIYW